MLFFSGYILACPQFPSMFKSNNNCTLDCPFGPYACMGPIEILDFLLFCQNAREGGFKRNPMKPGEQW